VRGTFEYSFFFFALLALMVYLGPQQLNLKCKCCSLTALHVLIDLSVVHLILISCCHSTLTRRNSSEASAWPLVQPMRTVKNGIWIVTKSLLSSSGRLRCFSDYSNTLLLVNLNRSVDRSDTKGLNAPPTSAKHSHYPSGATRAYHQWSISSRMTGKEAIVCTLN
jgi:hypothetical protein